MSASAPPVRRRLSDAESVLDALRYPLLPDALITNAVLVLSQLVVSFVPLFAGLLSLVVWAAAYRYALEVLTASGQGRREPPQGSLLTDYRSQRSHLWLQAVIVFGLVYLAYTRGPVFAAAVLLIVAFVLPAALLAMSAAQNMLAALNPAAWWAVLRIVGPGYLLLAAAVALTLGLQLFGVRLFDALPSPRLGMLLYFTLVHAALIASFRLIGTRLHAHAAELGVLEPGEPRRPELVRDREQRIVATEVRAAEAIDDPVGKAAALAPAIRRGGASDALQLEYRRCLRAAGQIDALRQHAVVRVCELLALGRAQPALVLTAEALADDPAFALPDADSTRALLDAAEAGGQLQQAVTIVGNYRQHFPKRYDALPLCLRAATLCADRLGDRERAGVLLAAVIERDPDGADGIEAQRLQRRLQAGLALGGLRATERADRRR